MPYIRTTFTGTAIACVPSNMGVYEMPLRKRDVATAEAVAKSLARAVKAAAKSGIVPVTF
jgi:ribose 1,5-bisphosphokinase PhnN